MGDDNAIWHANAATIAECTLEAQKLKDKLCRAEAIPMATRSSFDLLYERNNGIKGDRYNLLFLAQHETAQDQALLIDFVNTNASFYIGQTKFKDAPTLSKDENPAIYRLVGEVNEFYGLGSHYLAVIQIVLESKGFCLQSHKDKNDFSTAVSATLFGPEGLEWCFGEEVLPVGPGQVWGIGEEGTLLPYDTPHSHGPLDRERCSLVFRFRRRPCLPGGSAAAAESAPVAAAAGPGPGCSRCRYRKGGCPPSCGPHNVLAPEARGKKRGRDTKGQGCPPSCRPHKALAPVAAKQN